MIGAYLILSLDNRAVVDLIFGVLSVIYLFASISIEEFNRYSIFSLVTLIVLWMDLEITAYVLWSLILIWGVVHYICKPKDNNEIYVSAIALSIFGLYTKALIDVDSKLYANYALGIILLSICMTKGILKKWDKDFLKFIEVAVICGLTLFGAAVIEEPIDGVAYLGILAIVSILSYSKEWKTYLYSSIISMIFGVIVLTAEYWKELPWYVYILIIGLALISFAMYDEKRKQINNEIKEKETQTIESPILEQQLTSEPTKKEEVVELQVEATPSAQIEITKIEEVPIEESIEVEEIKTIAEETPSIKLQIVEDTSSTNTIKLNNQSTKPTGARKANKTTSVNKQKTKTDKNRR
jgi:hypothetical protein